MPIKNGVGISDATENKQHRLKYILRQHLIIVDRIFKKYPRFKNKYIYIDATSGTGKTDDNDGSPIIFLNQYYDLVNNRKNFNVLANCYFIDECKIYPETINELNNNISSSNKKICCLIKDKYQDALPKIIESEGFSYGIIYFDPNGIVDFDCIKDICNNKDTNAMDILFNYNAVANKRKRGVNGSKDLFELFKDIKKNNWYISEPNGKWQWSFFYGSNSGVVKLPKKIGFHNINSDEGKYIFHKLNYTKPEFKNNLPSQPKLEDFDNGGN